MAENKTKATAASVSRFVGSIKDPTQQKDANSSGREGDMPMIAFSPRKSATVLYSLMGYSGSEALLSKLGKHTTGKGCLYIKKLADVDEQVLKDLMANSLAAKRKLASS